MAKLLLSFLFFILALNANAQHPEILGSHISYRAIDTLTYEVKLTVIRECSGDLNVLNDTLILKADSLEFKQKPTFVSKKDITTSGKNCPNKSICAGGTLPYGFEERIYIDTFSLANIKSCDIYFVWTGNKRYSKFNTGYANLNHYNFAYLNYCATSFNNSYIFTSKPKILVYEGQNLMMGIRSVDTLEINDSAIYLFRNPKIDFFNGQYSSPYSSRSFLTYLGSFRDPDQLRFPAGIKLDSFYANIYTRPMKAGEQTLICLESPEYRIINGKITKIGITRWDMALIIVKSPLNKATQNKNIPYIPPNNFLCANSLNEFNFESIDADTADSARFRIDFSGYKNIAFSDTFITKDQSINIKWQPTSKDIRTIKSPYIINLKTYDNNCDVDGVNSLNIPFYLDDKNLPKFDLKDTLFCKGMDAVLRINSSDTNKIKNIIWDKKLDSDSFVISNSELPKTIEIKVTDTNTCVQIVNQLIDTFPTLNLNYKLSNNKFCENEDALLTVNFEDSKNIKNIIWNDSISSDSFKILSQNIPTTIKIKITDTFDCSFDTSKFIDNFPHQNPSFLIPDSICFNVDSIILKANPKGGIWKGNSIVDSVFYPSKNNKGWQKIQYNFTDTNNCNDIASHNLFVNYLAEPVIYVNPNTGNIPLHIYYNDNSFNNYDEYLWEFTNSKYVYKTNDNNNKTWITDTGQYDIKLIVTKNGCRNFAFVKKGIIAFPKNYAFIQNNTDLSDISVYPNPANEVLFIDFLPKYSTVEYQIFNLNGKEILKGFLEVNKNEIQLKNITQGFYLIEIKNDNQIILRTKFLKN